MSFQFCRMTLRIHPLVPIALLVMARLGAASDCLAAFLCVLVHEMGHLLAARASGLRVLSLDVMPFGGLLHISGLYRMSTARLLSVALAGPAVSLLSGVICAGIPAPWAMRLAATHWCIGLFNLLPALPLDGGRALVALLRQAIGPRRAVRIAALFGCALGFLLLSAAAALFGARGILSLPMLFAGVFLIACAGQERETCELTPAEDLLRLMRVNRISQGADVRGVALAPHVDAMDVIRRLRPEQLTMLAVLDEAGEVREWITDRQWLRSLLAAPEGHSQ